jgi:hypothetical protein
METAQESLSTIRLDVLEDKNPKNKTEQTGQQVSPLNSPEKATSGQQSPGDSWGCRLN